MRRLLCTVSSLIVFCSLCCAAQAQTTAHGEFTTAIINNGATFEVTVRMRCDQSIDLGSSNVAFVFETAGLSFPDTPVKGSDYVFHAYDGAVGTSSYTSTVTKTGSEISVNIGLVTIGNGAPLGPTFVDVVTIYMTIVNPVLLSGLVWTFTEVLDELFVEVDAYAFDDSSVLLPVELVSFEAQVDGADVLLRWETASETNNVGFEIHSKYASANLENEWQVLGFIEGAGTTLEPHQYSYRIEDLMPGPHIFRLKQIDFDGTFAYSPEVETLVKLAETFRLTPVYPNPSKEQARFTLAVRKEQRVRVTVYNDLGQRVGLLHDGMLAAQTTHAFTFDGTGLPSGVYFVRVTGETFNGLQKMVLVK